MAARHIETDADRTASIDALVAAAPPLSEESERIVSGILGRAHADLLAREATQFAAPATAEIERAA